MQRIQGKLFGPNEGPLSEVTRDELLWFFRTELEENHRWDIRDHAVHYTYTVSADDVAANCLPDISGYHWVDTCNKSVPVYIVPGGRWLLLRVVLHNYIYRRWFRPYRSEIDHQRFICKFIYPHPQVFSETITPSTIRDIISINQAVCAKVETQRSAFVEDYRLYKQNGRLYNGRNPDRYFIQPLFQALLIIVSDEKYNKETSKTVGNLPVYLVLTGIEEGLSAPISFEPIATKILSQVEPGRVIEVTIETAIDFVIGLEAREAAVVGLQPDPVTDWKPNEEMIEAWQSIGETEPLVGPNSQWVNDEKYPQWAGNGEKSDSGPMTRLEETQFRLEVKYERSRNEAKMQEATAESDAGKSLMG